MQTAQKFGYSLPHSSASQANCGKKVDIKDLQPGDLVFYRHGSRIGHVVMYIGDGKAVEAMGKKWGIVKSNLNYSILCNNHHMMNSDEFILEDLCFAQTSLSKFQTSSS